MFDDYFCVFYADQDIRRVKPVAIFDRAQFVANFISGCHGHPIFREEDAGLIFFTVREWVELYEGDGH